MRTRIWQIATGLGLATLTVVLRSLSWRHVFTERGVVFPDGTDGLYHMRRIWYSVVEFPKVLEFDSYVKFPHGGEIYLPPAYDWLMAAIARILVGPDDPHAAEVVLSWVPPLLGALTVLAVVWIGTRHFSRAAGVLAGLLLAVLPAHIMQSRVAWIDYHGAVAFSTTLLLAAGLAVLRPRRRKSSLQGWLAAGGYGMAIAACLLTSTGSLLHVAVSQAVLVAWMLTTPSRGEAVDRGMQLAFAHALAALLVAPFALGRSWTVFGDFSLLALTDFQVAWLFGGFATLLATAGLWRFTRLGGTVAVRLVTATAIGLAGVVLVFVLRPEVGGSLDDSVRWFSGGEKAHARISELQPASLVRLHARFTDLVWLFPLAWLWLAANGRNLREHPDRWLVLAWSAVMMSAALIQIRFNVDFGISLCIVLAAAGAEGAAALKRRFAPGRAASAVCTLLVLLLVAAALEPAWSHLRRDVEGGILATRSGRRNAAYRDAATWLASVSPPTRGYLAPEESPEYGVLAPWGRGHLIRYRAQRPLVQDNFLVYVGRENVALADRYFGATSESTALRLIEDLRVRYVFADPSGAGRQRGHYAAGTMTSRLQDFRRPPDKRLPNALSRHRLVYEAMTAEKDRSWPLFVYEIVPGALVEGEASPGADVRALLPLVLARDMGTFYAATARADVNGRYVLRLPYPTDRPTSPHVRAAGPYQITSGPRAAEFGLREQDVAGGLAVEGPDLVPEGVGP